MMDSCLESDEKKSDPTTVLAAVIFIAAFVTVGVPLWWETTKVYRVSLPYADIEKLSNLEVTHVVPVVVVLFDRNVQQSLLYEQLYAKSNDQQNEPSNTSLKVRYAWKMRTASEEEENIAQSNRTAKEIDGLLHESNPIKEIGVYQILVLDSSMSIKLSQNLVGCHRRGYVVTNSGSLVVKDIISVARTMVQQELLQKIYVPSLAYERKKPVKDRMRSLSKTTNFDIIFSLIVPQPEFVDVQWEIERAINAYIMPFIRKISPVAEVSIKSQVIYMLMLPTDTNYVSDHNDENRTYYLKADRLPTLINPIESRLGSYASTNSTLNFITYITTKGQTPMYIVDEKKNRVPLNAFLIPQWGGFFMINLDKKIFQQSGRPKVMLDMKEIMEVFLTQLRRLLGLPNLLKKEQFPVSILNDQACCDWELDFLMRKNTQEHLSVSASSLYSLGELLKKIRNIVIRDDIGEKIYSSVSYIKKSVSSLQQGFLVEGFAACKNAFSTSETAFFDTSLLSVLYFPEDQKYAVYIPLFLPISVPVLLSLRNIWLYWREKRRKEKEE